MSLDDYVEDASNFTGDLQVGDIPSIKNNSPPGPYITWSLYEPYQYEDEVVILTAIGAIGDCNIEGSDEDTMMAVGPPGCSENEMIKSDYFVDIEDLVEED